MSKSLATGRKRHNLHFKPAAFAEHPDWPAARFCREFDVSHKVVYDRAREIGHKFPPRGHVVSSVGTVAVCVRRSTGNPQVIVPPPALRAAGLHMARRLEYTVVGGAVVLKRSLT